jgi:peptide/nickel transport system permease protein
MLRIIANRALVAIPTLILVSMMIFGLQKMLPGDPVLAMAGEDQNPQVIATLRLKYR